MITATLKAQLHCDEPGCAATVETQLSVRVRTSRVTLDPVMPDGWTAPEVIPMLAAPGHKHYCPEHRQK